MGESTSKQVFHIPLNHISNFYVYEKTSISPSWAWPAVMQKACLGSVRRLQLSQQGTGEPTPPSQDTEREQIPAPFTLWGGTELTHRPGRLHGFLLGLRARDGPGEAPSSSEIRSVARCGAAGSHPTRTHLSLFRGRVTLGVHPEAPLRGIVVSGLSASKPYGGCWDGTMGSALEVLAAPNEHHSSLLQNSPNPAPGALAHEQSGCFCP